MELQRELAGLLLWYGCGGSASNNDMGNGGDGGNVATHMTSHTRHIVSNSLHLVTESNRHLPCVRECYTTSIPLGVVLTYLTP